MKFVSYGGEDHVTPLGIRGDGVESMLKARGLPAWLAYPGAGVSLGASLRVFQEHLRPSSSGSEFLLFCGEDQPGVSPKARLSLKKLEDNNNADWSAVGFETYTTAVQQWNLFRPDWRFHGQIPEMTIGGLQGKAQGMMFLDADTLVLCAHYNDTLTKVWKIDIPTWQVTGEFTFGSTYRHVASFAVNSIGEVWAADYDTGRVIQVDLDASFSSGSAVVLAVWDTSALQTVSTLSFMTVDGTEYALVGEYRTSGTPYMYIVPSSLMKSGPAFAAADRFKRFSLGTTLQGAKVQGSVLWVARNSTPTPDAPSGAGFLERYDDFEGAIRSSSDGATLTPAFQMHCPSGYPEDIDFHPTTGDIWTSTEGWRGAGGSEGWHSVWSTPITPGEVENFVELYYDGINVVKVKINGRMFATFNIAPTVPAECLTIMGPPNQLPGFDAGYAYGFLRNFRLQDKELTSGEYQEAVSGTVETRTLQEYDVTIVNGGAELGDTTGWVDEVGNIAIRSANPLAFEGNHYFFGGPNLSTRSRNRVDLTTASLAPLADIDDMGKEVWVRTSWVQSSWEGTDSGSVGTRALDSGATQLCESIPAVVSAPHNDRVVPFQWYRRGSSMGLPPGTRLMDLVFRAERGNGTNNDPYTDDIRAKIVVRPERLPDPLADEVVVQLKLDGPDQSTVVTDDTGRPWALDGNAKLSTARSKFGASSLLLDGSSGRAASPLTSDVAIGVGDFTIEAFVYATAVDSSRVIVSLDDETTIWNFFWRSNNVVAAYNSIDGTYTQGTTTLVANRWYHVAWVRESGVVRSFVDGVLQDGATSAPREILSSHILVGGRLDGSQVFAGNIDGVRITRGTARYRGNFAPPSRPYPEIN